MFVCAIPHVYSLSTVGSFFCIALNNHMTILGQWDGNQINFENSKICPVCLTTSQATLYENDPSVVVVHIQQSSSYGASFVCGTEFQIGAKDGTLISHSPFWIILLTVQEGCNTLSELRLPMLSTMAPFILESKQSDVEWPFPIDLVMFCLAISLLPL